MTYDPNISNFTSIPQSEPSLNEQLAIEELEKHNKVISSVDIEKKAGVPTGLLRAPLNLPEKDIEESQMADFATPIEDIMPGPGQMMQDEMMGSAHYAVAPAPGKKSGGEEGGETKTPKSKNPLGLPNDQYQAVLAGVAAVLAFSKPVQGKLESVVPKFLDASGEITLTGLAVTAIIAAVIFYLAMKYVN